MLSFITTDYGVIEVYGGFAHFKGSDYRAEVDARMGFEDSYGTRFRIVDMGGYYVLTAEQTVATGFFTDG